VCTEKTADPTNDRLEDLDLAVQVKAPRSNARAGRARPPITVVPHKLGHAVLEVAKGLWSGVSPVLRPSGEYCERREAIDEGQGVIPECVVELDPPRIVAISRQRGAGERPQLSVARCVS